MTTDEALDELRRRLAEAGFDMAAPDLSVLWSTYRAWCTLPVSGVIADDAGDMLLFECSLDLAPATESSSGPAFTVGFTRQFSFADAEGEYAGMEHVGVDLRYPVHEDFRALTTMDARSEGQFGTAEQFWGAAGRGAAEWVARVEASRAFQVALGHRAQDVDLFHTPV